MKAQARLPCPCKVHRAVSCERISTGLGRARGAILYIDNFVLVVPPMTVGL